MPRQVARAAHAPDMRGIRVVLFAIVVGLAAFVAGELGIRIVARLRHGRWTWRDSASLAPLPARTGALARLQEPPGKILHPYLGYLRDPNLPAPDSSIPPVTESGFRRWPDEENATGAFTIAILGGSLAERFSYHARETLIGELERRHVLTGKRKRILNVAMGGYKEPQQLAALAYLLSTGERPDVVVNLDGFNEVALSVADNLRNGINPFYPRMWAGLVQDVPDRDRLAAIGELEYVRRRRAAIESPCGGFLFQRSALCQLIESVREAPLRGREAELEARLERLPLAHHRLGQYGPRYPERPDAELFPELATHWARCSELMAQLCAARGIVYFHFLQPNQYVAGSKPMSAEERAGVLRPKEGYGPSAVAGYPFLISEGRALESRGVPFRDLTGIFRDTSDLVYEDDCCHLNALGNRILGREIARTIADRISSSHDGH